MLTVMNDLPHHVVGIRATGDVTKDDLENVLIPALDDLVERTDEIHYLLELQTPVKNFSLGAWLSDAKVGIKHLTKWKKIAIVTAEKGVEKFSDVFGIAVPGESKGFPLEELEQAKQWVSS